MNPRGTPGNPPAPGAARGHPRARFFWLALIAILYIVSIPWYRDAGAPLRLVGGLPDWVAVALGCYLLSALANVFAWSATPIEETVPDGEPSANPPEEGAQ